MLGLPDTAALNIINLNIDSIQKEIRNCRANRGQEMHAVTEDCTNKDAQSAVADKSKSSAMTQRIHKMFGDIFNGIGSFKGTFSLQLKPDSKPYQVPPRHVAYALQKLFKKEL